MEKPKNYRGSVVPKVARSLMSLLGPIHFFLIIVHARHLILGSRVLLTTIVTFTITQKAAVGMTPIVR
jgi:hypothetical protein